jgi:microcystin-dependent protein
VQTAGSGAGNNAYCFLGQIMLTAGNVAIGTPAKGLLLSISGDTAVLYSLLGTTYGGDGVHTFALPDLTKAAPNGMTYAICTEGAFPQRD